jgi:hypothetical protein
MPSVHVFSAGHGAALRHFERTIRDGIPVDEVRPFLDNDAFQAVRAASTDNRCYLWGDRGGEHGRMYWDRIEPSDLALCYSGRRIIAASYVVLKQINRPPSSVCVARSPRDAIRVNLLPHEASSRLRPGRPVAGVFRKGLSGPSPLAHVREDTSRLRNTRRISSACIVR